jgi:hypothetical protein
MGILNMGNLFINLFKRFTTSKRKLSPFLRPPQLTYLEERITPSNTPIIVSSNADSGAGTLRQAIIDANTTAGDDIINFSITGTITLNSLSNTVNASLPTIISASTPITGGGTAGTLTITGPGATSLTISGLDGGNGSRDFNIFNIASGGNLSISGVTVSGAKTSGNGGAFNNSGTLSVSNSTLSGNSAGTFGGAIFNNNGALTLTNSTLSGNNATYGGGISNQFGTITISNSTLSGNSATTSGGGIQNNGSLTVSNSTISGNSAATHGGGIFNTDNLTLTNSTLSGNSASNRGGGIYNSGTLSVTNSTIASNTAGTFGGGIHNIGAITPITLTNSTLSGNSASSNGGGINNIGTLNIANTIIANSTNGGDFAGNQPVTSTNNIVEDGSITNGAIAADPLLGPLQNNGGPTFTMALLPGSIAIGNGNSTISNASPVSGKDQRGVNRITSDIGAYSFGIQVTTTAASGTGSLDAAITLANNTPGNDDINFNLTGTSPYTITLAAALPTILNVSTAGTLTINGLGASALTINGNQGNFSIFTINTGGNLTISGVTVSGAQTTGEGGAFNNSGTLNVSNSTLSGNAANNGGGISNNPGSSLTVSNSTLSGNSATTSFGSGGSGGGIHNNGSLTVSNSTISGNSAAKHGGGIFNNSNLTLAVSNSTLSGNSAGTFGGAIFNNNGAITLTNSTLSGNNATYGGGIFNQLGTITISNSTLSGNSATTSGGSGGGIFNNSNLTLTVSNSTISGNSAAKHGGGIFNNSNLTLTNSTLSGNSASSRGGGIYNSGNNLTITNSTLSGNSAGTFGGGINNIRTLTLTNSTLSGNSANSGGGISNLSGSTLNIANTIIANSTSGGDYLSSDGTIGTNTNNLVEDGSLPGTGEITGDPLLGPLQNNGGPTFTQALLLGSVAIAAGNSTISNASPVSGKDQRGVNRITSDIGAYSYNFASEGDAVVSLDNTNQVVLTLSSSGTAITDFHTTYNSGANTLTITAATVGTLLTAPSAGIAGITINNVSAANTITLDLNTLVNFAGLVIVGNSGTDSVTIGSGGVDLSLVATGAANLSFTANILGTSNSTSALTLTNAIKTKGSASSTYLSAGTINGSGLITTSSITMVALSGIGNTTALSLAATSISADTNAGKIIINNTSVTAVSVTSLTTTGSDGITFNQTGLGGIGIDGPVSTGTGTITIISQKGISGTGLFTQANAAGVVTFNAGAGDITLTNAGNNFTGSVSLSNTGANNVAITDANTIDFGASTLGSGTFTVTAVGITQSGAITQASGAGSATFNAGAGVITLANASNDFTGSVALNSTGATVAITDTNALALASPNLGANTGITAIAGTTLTLPSFNFSTGTGNIDFQSASGTLATNGTLITSAGTVSLKGSAGVTVGHNITTTSGSVSVIGAGINLTSGNTIDAGSSTITLDGNDGAITLTGALTTTNNTSAAIIIKDASTVSIGDITTGATGFVTLGGATTDNLTGAVTQTGVINIGTLTGNTAGDVTLLGGNTITNLGTFTSTGTSGFSLSDLGGLTVTGTVTNTSGAVSIVTTVSSLTISADITATGQSLTLTGVGINQTTGTILAAGLTVNAGAGSIALNQANNNFTGSVTLNSTGATVAITDTNALALASPNLGANTGITAIAGTTLTLPSFNFSTGTGNIDFQSASGTLATNGTLITSAGTVSLKGSAGVTVGHNITTTSGSVSVIGAGINLTSGNTIDAGSSTITLDGNDGAITLTGALTTTNNTSAAIIIKDASTVSIGDITTGATGFVTLGGATTDNLTGAVTQTGVINIGTLTGNTAGDVTLLGGNTITNLGTFTSTGTSGFSLSDLGGLTVTGTVTNTSGAVSIVTTVSSLTISADITATGQSLTLTGVGINQTTGTILAAGLTVNAGAGSIALNQANNNFTGSVTLNSTGASVAITDANAIDLAASVLGSGTFTVNAVGITQSGAIIVAGTSSFNAGAGVITLTQPNDFTGAVSLNNSGANNVAIVDSNDITIGVTSLGTGTFAVTGTTINLNNNVTTTNNSQTYTGDVVVNANSGGQALVLSAGSGAISITGNIDSATGQNYSLTLTSTDDVTIGGTTGGIQALGSLLITGNDISLGNIGGANVGTTSNVSVQASDGADNGSISLTGTTYNTTGQQFYDASATAFDGTRPINLTGGATVSLSSGNGFESYGNWQLNNKVLSIDTTLSSATGGNIVINDAKPASQQVFEGPGSLIVNAGTTGNVNINGAIGTAGTPLNSMTITNAANADFTGSIKVNTITITDTTDGGIVRFQGNLTVNTGMTVSPNGAYNVEILELSNVAGETTFGNSGLLTLGNAGSDVFNFTGGIIATNPSAINLIGTITAAGTGLITLGDSNTSINIKNGSGAVGGTSTGIINLGNAILEDGVTLTVGTGIANTINMAAVTGTASGTSSNLTINTTGAVTVAGAVGTDIGLLTITNSGGTTFQSTVAAATATITNTTGNVKFEGNLNLTTSLITANQGYNVSITGTSNNIAGATTFANTGAVTLGNGDSDSTTFAGGLVITAPASIAIQGTVATTNATMTLGDANTGITNNGTFSNPAILNAGTGIINLAGNVTGNGSNNPLKVITSGVGFTTVSGVNTAELQLSSGVVTIANQSDQTGGYRVSGGTLQGGTMAKVGYIYAQTGTSTLAPGINGPGMMHTNSLLLSSGNTVEIDLQGTNPATGYDQIVVCKSGNVNLASATLSLSSSFTGNQGTIFTIIDNQDPTTAIQGTFAGLSEGAVVSVNGRAYQISYVGGTGNDVTLTVYDPATVTSFTPIIGKSGTSVVITGSNFINVSQVSFNGTFQPTYTVDSPTQITTTIPSGATTGTISVTTIAGTATSSSTITIDNTAPTLNISASPSSLKANETSTITFTFSEVVTGFSSSIITVTNGTLSTPVASNSTVYTATFTPTLGIKADGTISVSNNYFDSVGNQGTAATLTPPIAINTVQTPLVTGGASTTQGGASVVSLIDPDTGEVIGSAAPFPSFTGQIRVVSGDFNNDGKVDIIAAAGPGGGPAVAVLDSETGEVIESFFAFDPAFTGGVFIAVRDFNGDGLLDIIAGAGAGGGPEVRIFNGNGLTVIRSFFAYAQDFTGGVSVANIDFNNDGILDLVTGAGPGGAPHVKVFDGATSSIISQWYAYPVSFTGGVYVAAGDIGNDGNIEVVTGAGSGGAPVVAVWDPYTGALLSQFMAYAEDFTGGVRVGVSDGNFDGILDLVTGAGPGGGPEVKGFSFPTLDLLFSFFSGDPTNTDGVFVS